MGKSEPSQYHCCFLLDKASSSLNMAIAWKRVGSCDFGLYLTKRHGVDNLAPLCTMFKASYSGRGEIASFHVKDGLMSDGARWDDDHVNMGFERVHATVEDLSIIESLAGAFIGEWLESFGQSEASMMIRRLRGGSASGTHHEVWHQVLLSGLPVEIQKGRLPDILACAEISDHGLLYAFVPYPERVGSEVATSSLLEAKMRAFFELL